MSFVVAAPEALAAAAAEVAGIGSAVGAAHAVAAGATTSVAVAAGDEVSAAIASLFGGYGQDFQALGVRAGVFHAQFVSALRTGGLSYAAGEAANASPLQHLEQDVLGVINAPTNALFNRPLIGNGVNGAAGTGAAGGSGPDRGHNAGKIEVWNPGRAEGVGEDLH